MVPCGPDRDRCFCEEPGVSDNTQNPKASIWQRLQSAGNHDFCPGLNRYVYWMKQPIGWFALGFLASLLSGIFIGPQGYLLAIALGLVIGLGVIWPWLSLRGIQVQIKFLRRRITEGETIVVVAQVINRWPLPVWGLALERGFPHAQRNGETVPWLALSGIGPWTETEFEWEIPHSQRGLFPLETPRVSNGFPFGLWRCERPVTVLGEIRVWPRTYPLRSLPEVVGDQVSIEGCETLRAGQEGEVVDIREFRRGDTLRQVHWAQTARRGKLMVRERQNKSRREVRVTVDTDPSVHFGAGRDHSAEWALRIAASICREFHAHHFHVTCWLGDRAIAVPDQMSGIAPILDTMSCWRAEAAAPFTPTPPSPVNSDSDVLEFLVTTSVRVDREPGWRQPRMAGVFTPWIVIRPAVPEEQQALADIGARAWSESNGTRVGRQLDLQSPGFPIHTSSLTGAEHVVG